LEDILIAGVRILIVADEPEMKAVLQRMLERCGFELQVAASAAEALRIAPLDRFHAALLSLPLARSPLFDFVHAWKSAHPQTPLILVSANPSIDEVECGMAAGAFDYLARPCTSGALLNSILAALGREPTPRELAASLDLVGTLVEPEAVEDLLWTILMLPEVQLIE